MAFLSGLIIRLKLPEVCLAAAKAGVNKASTPGWMVFTKHRFWTEFLDNNWGEKSLKTTKQLEKIASSCTVDDVENSLRNRGGVRLLFRNDGAGHV